MKVRRAAETFKFKMEVCDFLKRKTRTCWIAFGLLFELVNCQVWRPTFAAADGKILAAPGSSENRVGSCFQAETAPKVLFHSAALQPLSLRPLLLLSLRHFRFVFFAFGFIQRKDLVHYIRRHFLLFPEENWATLWQKGRGQLTEFERTTCVINVFNFWS